MSTSPAVYPHDVAKAKELLKEAGLENGFKATLKLPPPAYARLGGEIIASELRDVGIDLEIIPVEWAQWLDQVFTKKDYDLTIVSHTEPNDIDIYSRKDYYFNYDNPAFDKIIADLTSPPTKPSARNCWDRRKRSWPTMPWSASSSNCPRLVSGTPSCKACGKTRRSRPMT